MKFGFILDEPRIQPADRRFLVIRCAWCGRNKMAITDRNNNPLRTNICQECAARLLLAENLYRA